ncbi:MAG: hypothetical protein IPL84_17540 [Chitinophagaceae bacterium]|nr:hypothetical protein [Chitinophagaceae bacterium]
MINLSDTEHQNNCVSNFDDLVSTPFHGDRNAICWARKLTGNFAEIVNKVTLTENIVVLDEEDLLALKLSEHGQLARNTLLADFKLLKAHGASPTLNIIRCYESDEGYPFFPTDVYSFHIDSSPVATDTFLCTYYGEPSELLPNLQARQKVLVPEIRDELKKLYDGAAEGFESFLSEHFFDLHYQAIPAASPVNLGLGNLWRLAVDHPKSQVLPCVHRAPKEKAGQHRLLMIC